MKTKILIVEDCCYRFFTMRQLIENRLHMNVEVEGSENTADLITKSSNFNPDILICHPSGGVIEVLESLKRKQINCRNATIKMIAAADIDAELGQRLIQLANKRASKEFVAIARAA
jgi:hypothetical protein